MALHLYVSPLYSATIKSNPSYIRFKNLMLENIKTLFSEKMHSIEYDKTPDQKKISIAACALLLEMAHADSKFSSEEKNGILEILKENFDMDENDARELVALADEERKESLDLWQFTNLINENYSREDKLKVVDTLWKVIYTDGKVDKHEDYLIRKLTFLLNLQHEDMIAAKIKVRESFENQ
jgi:uncharacterized tellurite resistance protein B-like protein